MKLVTMTQYQENYGSSEHPFWKNKGGYTYVVTGLGWGVVAKDAEAYAPLLKLLEDKVYLNHDYSNEYLIDWYFAEDDEEVCETWSTPEIFTVAELEAK